MSNYQIVETFNSMLYMLNSNNNVDGKQLCLSIVRGFSGQIRGWWEWVLGGNCQNEILNSKKIINQPRHNTPHMRFMILKDNNTLFVMKKCRIHKSS